VSYLDPKYGGRTPTFEGWSFGFQRLLTKDITATLSYVGNQGHFLLPTGVARGYWGNQLNPAYLSLGSAVLGATATATNVPGGLPYATFNNKVSQALLAFPQYSGVTDQVDSVGNANYNALQLSIVQRLSHGITFMVNYTYSKTIDDIGTFRTGYAIPTGILANSGKAWPIDRIERSRRTSSSPAPTICLLAKGTSAAAIPLCVTSWADGASPTSLPMPRAIRWRLPRAPAQVRVARVLACPHTTPAPTRSTRSAAARAKTADGGMEQPETVLPVLSTLQPNCPPCNTSTRQPSCRQAHSPTAQPARQPERQALA
jgi:hypothetical protein